MPALLEQTPFVLARLKKMQPGADSIWETDPVEKLAVLKQMYAFVSPLQPAFNSPGTLLYNILDHSVMPAAMTAMPFRISETAPQCRVYRQQVSEFK